MGLYERYLLPHVINAACGSKPIQKQRAKIVPKASGTVLEIGFGSGRNAPFYDAAKVTRLIATEPEKGIRALGEKALAKLGIAHEMRPDPAEALSLANASVDTVVCAFTLCTVHAPVAALREARRVLKPGGRLLFCEHGRAPDATVQRTQAAIEPVWSALAGGCKLTREPLALLAEAGFQSVNAQSMYLPGTPRFAGFNTWGEAQAG